MYLLSTITRDAGTEFHVHQGARQSNQQTDDPDEKGKTDAPREPEDGTRRAIGRVQIACSSVIFNIEGSGISLRTQRCQFQGHD